VRKTKEGEEIVGIMRFNLPSSYSSSFFFSSFFFSSLFHFSLRVLVWEQAGKRQGTHQAKGRGDVNGSTRKLAAQKKRGTARVGGKNPPHHRGGGRAFPPRPRDHSFDLPAKVVKYGLRVALSTRFAEDQLFLMEPMKLESHKTKLFYKLMAENHNLDSELILLIGGREVDRNLYLASKCIPKVNLLAQNQINVYDILRHQRLLLSVEALPYLTNRLAPESYTKTFIVPPFVPPTTTLLLPPTTSFHTDTSTSSSSSTNSTTSL
jgi:large subunit ribosomal protein L4